VHGDIGIARKDRSRNPGNPLNEFGMSDLVLAVALLDRRRRFAGNPGVTLGTGRILFMMKITPIPLRPSKFLLNKPRKSFNVS
jgi:hypothetical protein